ncbi:MAG: transglycosylase domain-containing protein, partial [Rhodospirillales bacterium]
MRRFILRTLKWLAVGLVGVPLALTLVYRFVPVPLTPLMVIRAVADGDGIDRTWVPLSSVSRHAPRAAIAAEDNLFCRHGGFDWGSIEDTIDDYVAGRRTRGASTISMQTAKNVFLWPGRDFLRKGLEAYL